MKNIMKIMGKKSKNNRENKNRLKLFVQNHIIV